MGTLARNATSWLADPATTPVPDNLHYHCSLIRYFQLYSAMLSFSLPRKPVRATSGVAESPDLNPCPTAVPGVSTPAVVPLLILLLLLLLVHLRLRLVRLGRTSEVDNGLLRTWALYWAATRPECDTYCAHDEVSGGSIIQLYKIHRRRHPFVLRALLNPSTNVSFFISALLPHRTLGI